MGCLDDASCPVFLLEDKAKIEDWALRDPRGLPLDEYREMRDAIRKKVEGLAAWGAMSLNPFYRLIMFVL